MPSAIEVNGRTLTYYIVFVCCAALFLLLLRIVNSPFGRVLQAIRENPFRAEALGYRTVVHRTLANVIAAAVAAAVGALNAIWLRYTGPDTSLSFAIMLDILLIVVIGGMGTMYGAIIGGTLFILAQNYLQALMGAVSTAAGEAEHSDPAAAAASGPLAALARHPVHRQRLFLSERHRRQTARRAQLDATPSKGMPMTLAPLLNASPVIQIHAFAAMAAFALASCSSRAERHAAAPDHRLDWVTLMAAIAISSFWIHEIRLLGPFSPIHALSIFTLVMLPLAVLHARNHRVTQHRKAMISIFVGALVIAGAFTFLPGRIMHAVAVGN